MHEGVDRGTLYGNACNTRPVRTFLGHECRVHSIVSRRRLGLKCQCRKAKHVITRYYSRRVPRSPREFYGTMLSDTHDIFDSFWLACTPAPAFPAGYSTAGIVREAEQCLGIGPIISPRTIVKSAGDIGRMATVNTGTAPSIRTCRMRSRSTPNCH